MTVKARSEYKRRIAAIGQPKNFIIKSNSRESKMLTDNIAYLRPGPFINYKNQSRSWDNSQFIAFINTAFEDFIKEDAEALVIDLRENPGGDNSFSDHMIAWFADDPFRFASAFLIKSSNEAAAANKARIDGNPDAAAGISQLFAQKYAETERGELFSFDIPFSHPKEGLKFEGDVYVIVNRHSYSQAVNVAATIQDFGLGKIVGEQTADFATSYGSIETFALDQTGFVVNFPKAHIIRPSGDKLPGGVIPDIFISSPVRLQTEDVVLKQLVSEIEAHTQEK